MSNLCPNNTEPQFQKSTNLSIASISMFKDEEDVAYLNLVWQYDLGIKKFVVLDNFSSDGTDQKIRQFAQDYPQAEVYVIEDREIGYYQSRKMTALAEFAYSLWNVEWIFPCDADEFLCCFRSPLDTVLESVSLEHRCIRLPLRNHYLRSFYNSEVNPLKRMTHRNQYDAYTSSKVLIRWYPGIVIAQGNHDAYYEGESLLKIDGPPLGLLLRHYPFRSKDHIRKKIVNGGRAYAKAPDLHQSMGYHWRQGYEQYQLRGEEVIDQYYDSMVNEPGDPVYDPAII